MATIKLYSVQHGKQLDFELRSENGEILAERGDETIKFPGGLSKEEFLDLVDQHNEANKGMRAITDAEVAEDRKLLEANEKLLESLS